MHEETVNYVQDKVEFKGYVAYDEKITVRRPCVLVAHAWKGQDDFARERARELAELGYVGFAVDLYGKDPHGNAKEAKTNEEADNLMLPLFLDRNLLQERMKAAYEAASMHPMVDPKEIGGIGFCFGGLAIIELFRSGAPLKGVVSFHAVLGAERNSKRAKTCPIAKGIGGSILILHGFDDPLVSSEDIQTIQQELTHAKVDWQMYIYGSTSHAFTNPKANDLSSGLIYNQKTSERAWVAMNNFFDEVFIPRAGTN